MFRFMGEINVFGEYVVAYTKPIILRNILKYNLIVVDIKSFKLIHILKL